MIFLGSIEIGLACEFLHTQRHFGRTFILPRSRGAAFLHSQDPEETLAARFRCSSTYAARRFPSINYSITRRR